MGSILGNWIESSLAKTLVMLPADILVDISTTSARSVVLQPRQGSTVPGIQWHFSTAKEGSDQGNRIIPTSSTYASQSAPTERGIPDHGNALGTFLIYCRLPTLSSPICPASSYPAIAVRFRFSPLLRYFKNRTAIFSTLGVEMTS
jgi:hypothetical protein